MIKKIFFVIFGVFFFADSLSAGAIDNLIEEKPTQRGIINFYTPHIYIDQEWGYTEEEIIKFLGQHPNPTDVKSITINYHETYKFKHPLTEKVIQYISDNFTKLNLLRLLDVEFDNEKLKEMNFAFPLVRDFDLGIVGSEGLDEGAETLALAMPNLISLHVHYGKFADNAVDAFFRFCPKIAFFQYYNWKKNVDRGIPSYVHAITDNSLVSMATYGKNLRIVRIDGQLLTWDGLKFFLIAMTGRDFFHASFYENEYEVAQSDVEELFKTYTFTRIEGSYRNQPAYVVPPHPFDYGERYYWDR